MAKSTGVEYGKALKDKATLGNGITEKQKVLVYTFRSWGIVTKGSFKIRKKMASEHKDIITVKHT